MDCAVELRGVSCHYPGHERPAIHDMNLRIEKGTFLLISGASGSGKTTLSRCINGLVPRFYEGDFQGEVYLNGKNTADFTLRDFGRRVGSVFQDPRSQFFMTDTTHEIAFGCVNIQLPREAVWERTAAGFQKMDITHLMDRSIFRLSSGEMQKVAIAACYAMGPDIYVFDEPSANLDSGAVMALHDVLSELKNEGKTIIVLEHRVFYLSDLLDRMIVLKDGVIQDDFNQSEALALSARALKQIGLRNFNLDTLLCAPRTIVSNKTPKPVLSLSQVSFTYKSGRKHAPADTGGLSDVSFEAYGGEIIALIGENGAGKTTLAKLCCGLLKETAGSIALNEIPLTPRRRLGRMYFVMQDSDYQLFGDSVRHELMVGAKKKALDSERHRAVLEKLSLWEERERHPATLSRGQKQRLTIADALISGSRVLFFDEPTSGLDRENMLCVASEMADLAKEGRVIFMITHDYEFILAACHRVLCLSRGRIQKDFPLNESSKAAVLRVLRQGGDSTEW